MQEGLYEVRVKQYTKRETKNVGFDFEIEYNGEIHSFSYAKAMRNSEKVTVATFNFSHKDGFKLVESLPSTQASRKIWGLDTNSFHDVSMVVNSPNFWGDNAVDNEHYFFILENCRNDDVPRGFYNEFMKPEFNEHRKGFELLGASMKVEDSDEQLSGLGFSTTRGRSLICRVSGTFNRVVKINF